MKFRSIVFIVLLPWSIAYADNFVGTATLEVQVSDSMQVTEVDQLSFGVIKPTLGGGYVNIHAVDDGQNHGGVGIVTYGKRANWNIVGVPGRNLAISLPGNGAIKLVSNNDEIVLDNFHTNLSNNALGLDGTGIGSFYVGARALISALQPIGNYEGTYNVTLSYQ